MEPTAAEPSSITSAPTAADALLDLGPDESEAVVDGQPRRTAGFQALRRETTFRRLLAFADASAVVLALLGAVAVGDGSLKTTVVGVPLIFILGMKVMGLYDRDAHLLHKVTLDEVPRLFSIATGSVLALWLSGTLLVDGALDRTQALVALALLFGGLVVFRSTARMVARRVSAVERCLFVGEAADAEEFREKLAASPGVKAELAGLLQVRGRRSTDLQADEANRRRITEQVKLLIAELQIDRVVLGAALGRSDELMDSIRRIKDHGVKVSVLPGMARVVNTAVELDRLNGITLLGVRRFAMTSSSRVIKRGFDIVGSALVLGALTPLLLFVAIAIKLDSRGPVLFRQVRAGRHGEPFEMLKFRSMVDGADRRKEALRHLNEADGLFKIAADPRITRVGRVIRRLNIDELPQLLNVVKGQMSLVGPRPLVLDEDRAIEGWHRRRLDVRPGITGPWQVLGASRIPVREMVRLDYQYVADWSLWNDIRILALTIPHVFGRRGL